MNASRMIANLVVVMVLCCARPLSTVAEDASRIDIEVTVRHLNGREEVFGREVAKLDIVLAPDGSIKYVHMVLLTDGEKDTHLWYNYANLAGLRYRFLAITGKGKVSVKQISGFEPEVKEGVKQKSPVVSVDDFK